MKLKFPFAKDFAVIFLALVFGSRSQNNSRCTNEKVTHDTPKSILFFYP